MTKSIPYGRQSISQDDIDAVIGVMKSDWLTQGPATEGFEKAVAGYCGANYAVAVNSATSALHIACLASGLSPGDTLWTSPNTFVASANCALYCGASVDFVDIDSLTCNLSSALLEKKLSDAQKNGTVPKVVVPVHFAGHPCEMAAIGELSKRYGFSVIEDASHAIGASYRGEPVGACTFSDMAVFSFHPVKIVTTGEGGMVLTNRKDLYEKLCRLRSHGITRDPSHMAAEPAGPWYYEQVELGYNYRMTDIQAALGTSQLQRLNEFVSRRNALAARYSEKLRDLPLQLPANHPDCYPAWHLYVVRLQLTHMTPSHREVFEALRSAGIQVNLHYIPVHMQPFYRARGFNIGDFPHAEQYCREAITLPLYYDLSEADQDYVIGQLRRIVA